VLGRPKIKLGLKATSMQPMKLIILLMPQLTIPLSQLRRPIFTTLQLLLFKKDLSLMEVATQ